MDQAILQKISSLDWDSLYNRLQALAVHWSKRFFGKKWNNLPKGLTHDDVVEEAIRRAFSKNWSHFDNEEFEKFLAGAVQSVVSNLRKSYASQKTEPMDLFNLANESDADVERELDKEYVHKIIQEKVKKNERLAAVYKLLCEGHESKDIAKLLDIPVTEVYNLNKKIIRIIEQIAEDINGSEE